MVLIYRVPAFRPLRITHHYFNKFMPVMFGGQYHLIKKKARMLALKGYMAGRFSAKDSYVLTASPRSGSTLMGQVLGAMPRSCVLFEPLQLDAVPEARNANFSWRTFVEPGLPWPEGKRFFQRLFEGRMVNEWIAKETSFRSVYNSNKLVIKFVRANRLLPWLCHAFGLPSPILLIRHPCAVVASQLNYGWKNTGPPAPPEFLDRFPRFLDVLSKLESDVENLAAIWALDQLPPMLHSRPYPWMVVTYEELVAQPESTLTGIFSKWNLDVDMSDALERIQRPSSVVSSTGISGVNGWKEMLTDDQVSRVLNTVRALGLSFYSYEDEPDYAMLHSPGLADQIRVAGTA